MSRPWPRGRINRSRRVHQLVETIHAPVAEDAAPPLVVADALDVDRVEAGVPGGRHVALAVADVVAATPVRVDAEFAHRDLDRVRRGFPPRLVGTADDRVEATAEVEPVE